MNKRIPILCVFFFLLNGAFNLNWAQSTLTLREAIDKSSTTHPLIKSAEETSEIKAQAFKLTNKELLPEVNLYAQVELYVKRPLTTFPIKSRESATLLWKYL